MHKALPILAGFLFAFTPNTHAQAAPVPLEVRLICYDLLVYPATIEFFGGIEDRNHFSAPGFFAPNDELPLAPAEVPTSHHGTFHYTDGIEFETFRLPFELNLPGRDANENLIPDILEFGQALPAVNTDGIYTAPGGGEGEFVARWSKPGDSNRGTVQVFFDFLNEPFIHTFEILNYSGTWTNAVKENSTVHGPVTVSRQGVEGSTLSGELSLSLAQAGAVKLTTTSLKDENNLGFEWDPTQAAMSRDRTEYFDLLFVKDGWLYQGAEDFHDWLIVVEDKNDFDADGIPNLTDPPNDIPATAPSMQIIKTENGVRLVITGDVGRPYTLESATALPAATWSNPTTVTLTTSPQTIDLPAPAAPTFWRMRFP